MERVPKTVRVVVIGALILVVAAAGGRLLIGSANPKSSGALPEGSKSAALPLRGGIAHAQSSAGFAASAPISNGSVTSGSASPTADAAGGGATTAVTPQPSTVVTPIGPQVVRTATLSLKVTGGGVQSVMSKIANLAAVDGGYVQSSSMSGGTVRSSPSTGQMVIELQTDDLTSALGNLGFLGKVTAESTTGQDVTGQVAENAATLDVLQQEVNLLESQLSKATALSDFLQIQGQLFPIAQQLQQLQSQQSVLENSAAMATVTINLNGPVVPVGIEPGPRSSTNAVTSAWRYLRHNTLAVLDGIAVAGGWALPLVILGSVVWFVVSRIMRRRRPRVTPA